MASWAGPETALQEQRNHRGQAGGGSQVPWLCRWAGAEGQHTSSGQDKSVNTSVHASPLSVSQCHPFNSMLALQISYCLLSGGTGMPEHFFMIYFLA